MGLEDNYGKIPLRRVFKPFFEAVFDTTSGHDHDGVNSKLIEGDFTLEADSIDSTHLKDNAVITDRIAANAVTGAKILDGAITGAKIPAQTITTTHLADTNVTEPKIGAGAVTATKIGDGAVIAAKIGADAVIEAKIQNGAVTADKIGTDAVIEAKIQNGAVTENKIGAAAVTAGKIAADAVITAKILDANVTADKIAAGAVTAVKLNADVAGDGLALNGGTNALEITVDDSTIETNADTVRVKALGIDTAQLAAGAVTNEKLANISQGSVKVGGAADAPTDLDASGDGKILVGDGTDLNSVAVSGDVTLANTGKMTITGVESTEFEIAKGSGDNRIKLVANADTTDALLTVTSAALTEARTATFPDATGTIALTTDVTGTDGTTNADYTVKKGTANKIKIAPNADAADKTLTLTSAALDDDRTVTLQNADGTVALTSDVDASTGTSSLEFEVGKGTGDNRIKIAANADTTDAALTITSAALSEARTATFPDASGSVVLADAEQYLENKTIDELVLGDGTSKFMEIKTVDRTSSALGGATATISLGIPAGALLIGVTLNNESAVTNNGDDTYTAAFSGGSTIALNGGAAIAAAQNTKTKEFIDSHAAAAITNNTTNILLTPQGADFTGGVVRAVVVYAEMVDLPDNTD